MRTFARIGFRGWWGRLAPRLLASFTASIVLTVAVGLVALQQLSGLTSTTTELASRDLPEIARVTDLRDLLFREADINRSRLGASIAARQISTLTDGQVRVGSSLEPIASGPQAGFDGLLIRQIVRGVAANWDLSQKRLALVRRRASEPSLRQVRVRQSAVVTTLITETRRLLTLEESEAASDAARARANSEMASQFVLTVIVLSVAVALVLAFLLTRSLTKPLSSLHRATDQIARGDLSGSPLLSSDDELGQLSRAFETMRISLRSTIQQLESERQQTQAVIDATTDGVILVDHSQHVLQMNPAAESITGWPSEEASGLRWSVVLGLDSPGEQELLQARRNRRGEPSLRNGSADTREPYDGHQVHIHPRTGRHHWLALSMAPIRWDSAETAEERVVITFHDISDLKAIDQMKSDFVAMVSHELRAPLTNVAGAVEMLSDAGGHGEETEIITILRDQTKRLQKVVDNVLQVTRLEAGQLQLRLKPVEMVTFLRSACSSVSSGWKDKRRISVHAPRTPVFGWADIDALELVIRNLLENARQYTPPGTSIQLDMHVGVDDTIRIDVLDHGAGIPSAQLDHIFDRFSRGADADWHGGYGLGLFIVREVIRAHGGEVQVRNREEGGACFSLFLRSAAATRNARQPAARSGGAA